MKAIKNILDNLKTKFEKGEKLERFMPVFETFETFFFVPGDTTPKKGAHIRDALDSKRLMIMVVFALIPSIIFGMWNTGYQHFLMSTGVAPEFIDAFVHGLIKILPLIVVSYAAALGVEFIFCYIKGKELEEGVLVTGMLIPLIVPVDVPLWQLAVATAFAIIFAKEVFGGTGMNIVNPALLTRAFLFFAYPKQMSGDKVWVSEYGDALANKGAIADGFSGATPLAEAAAATTNLDAFHEKYSLMDMFMGWIPGSVGETSVLMIILGAILLIYTGVASWKIILSGVIGGALMGFLLNLVGSDTNIYMQLPFYEHLMLGGFAFGIVFMATDPVSAAQTEKGKWIYGFLIGFIAILVRVLNPAYPEGVMLAILLMNVFSPLIDHYVVRGNVKKRLKRLKVSS